MGDLNQKKIEKNLKLISKSAIIVLIGTIVSKIITFVYRIIVARYYGPEIYGVFSLALIIIGLFVAVSSLGLSQGLVRYVAFYRGKNQKNKLNYTIHFILIILILSSIFSGILMFFLSEKIAISLFQNQDLVRFLKIFSFLIPISLLSGFYLSILKAFEEISIYSFIVNILQNIIKLLFIIIFLLIGFGIDAIIFSYFLGVFIALMVAYFVCKYKLSGIFIKSNLKKKQ